MADIKAGVHLSLKDQLSQGMKGAGSSVKEFGKTALGAVEKVNKAFSGLAGTLGTIGVTIGVGAAVKTYIDLDDRIVRIGTDIGATAEKTNQLKRRLYEVAQDPNIKLGTDSLMEAMEVFSSRNFDADSIMNMLDDVGLAMKATGTNGADMANLFIESFKQGMSVEEVSKSLDAMSVIGDTIRGGYGLDTFSQALPGLEAVNSLLGKSALNTTELYTAMQVLNQGTKSEGRTMAAFTAVVNELADPNKQKMLRQLGVEVTNDSGQMRNLPELLNEIAASSEEGTHKFQLLSSVFSGAAMDSVMAYKRFGNLAAEVENLGDVSGEIQSKAARNAASLKSSLGNLQTAFMAFADENLTKPLEKLTELLNKLQENPEQVKKFITGITAAIAALGAVKIGAGVVSFIANLKGIKGGKVDLSGATGGGAGIPVHVTNWGGSAGSSSLQSLQNMGSPNVGSIAGGNDTSAGQFLVSKVDKAAAIALPAMVVAGLLVAGKKMNEIYSNEESKKRFEESFDSMPAFSVSPQEYDRRIMLGWTKDEAAAGKKENATVKENIPALMAEEINSVPQIPEGTSNPVLEGNAALDVNVNITDDRTTAMVKVRDNDLPMRFNTGSVHEARGLGQ
jgi:TP901 family phage tail tape measure protein